MPDRALPDRCDVLVAGAGAGGMAAALAARDTGATVLLVEATDLVGGSTALSGGVIWTPGNALPPGPALEAELVAARAYIAAEAGNRFDAARTEGFLRGGPEMVRFMQDRTALTFQRPSFWPDYHADLPGSAEGGRSMRAATFDGRGLGGDLRRLRPALREMTLLGGMMVGGEDLPRLAGAFRRPRDFAYAGRLLLRYLADRTRFGRASRLTNGAALAAALLHSLRDAAIEPRTGWRLEHLQRAEGRIVAAELLDQTGRRESVAIDRGVILAGGGMAASPAQRVRLYTTGPAAAEQVSLAPPGNCGGTMDAALAIGAALADQPTNPAAWVPLSRVPRADGGFGWFPHFFDRSKPGFILVNRAGRRFANEALSYHDLGAAILEQEATEAFILCDHRAIRRYGLGVVRPAPLPLGRHLHSGYLAAAREPAVLARHCGIDPDGLAATLKDWNESASRGEDPLFGKGHTAYERYIGDAAHRPNPCVAPLEQQPFYALRVVLGDIGSFVGLRTDAAARVLDVEGRAIPRLYAAGNDAASLFGGSYPAAGITLGPALTFGYLAGRHCAALAD